jgi:transposase InsO family protein
MLPVVAPQLQADVTLILPDGTEHANRIVLDSGNQTNVIGQRNALALGLEKVQIPSPGELRYPGNFKGMVYAAYAIRWRATDSMGVTKEQETFVYGTDEPDDSILIGMPGMRDACLLLDTEDATWRYKYNVADLQLEDADQFFKSFKENKRKAFVCTVRLEEGDPQSERVRLASISTQEEHPAAQRLLTEHSALFQMPDVPTPVAGGEHAIETVEDPPFGRIYNLSPSELAALKDYLEVALERGWISHSKSPAGSPILFVPKKDGGLRLCVDYRALNKVTVKNRMALPLISEILDRVSGATVFSKVDLEAAYHRIGIRKEDRWKTAFRTRYGHFEYNVMPFGLTNAPATFQAYINQALGGLVDVCCVVYLDDILIYSKNEEDHEKDVRQVLERLERFALYANSKKCAFFTNEIEYLGFLISPKGVRMDPMRIAAISEWPTPKSGKDVQIFLGFVNFYRRFIEGFAHISRPLSDLLKGSKDGKHFQPWRWRNDQEIAFRWLRDAFTKAPVLSHFDATKELMVETDASAFAAGAILSQLEGDGRWHPIAFWSRKFIPAEMNYKVHDQELLAIVESFRHWRHYLAGASQAVTVLTDHHNLQGFMKVTKLGGRQIRWCEELANYDFHIRYRRGSLNPADGPSRRPDYVPTEAESHANRKSYLPTLQRKLGLLRTDLGDGEIQDWIAANSHESRAPSPPVKARISDLALERFEDVAYCEQPQIACNSDETEMLPRLGSVQCVPFRVARIAAAKVDPVHGDLDEATKTMTALIAELQRTDAFTQEKRRRLDQDPTGPWSKEGEDELVFFKDRLYVPGDYSLRRALIERFHDAPLAGHFGKERTLNLIQRQFHWVGVEEDVQIYVARCKECQWSHAKRHRPYGKLQSLEKPEAPWTDLSMDFITDLPPSKGRQGVYDAILVITDRYTKMVLYTPTTKTVSAENLADIVIERVVSFAGVPRAIVSDRGPQFTSLFWQEFCVALQIKRKLSTAYHPQTDGATERQNQTLENCLRIFCNEEQDNWAKLLPLVEFAYNNSIHSVTHETPFHAMYGFHPRATWEDYEVEELQKRLGKKKLPALKERLEGLRVVRDKMSQRLEKARESQAKYYDRFRAEKHFNVGDQVMLSTKNLTLARPKKGLGPKYLGPLTVQELVGQNAYRLRLPDNWRIHDVVNVSQLEDWVADPNDANSHANPNEDVDLPKEVATLSSYDVEAVVDHRWTKKGGIHHLEYLVRWEGDWPQGQKETWEPEDHLRDAPEAVAIYRKGDQIEMPRSNLSQKAGVRKQPKRRSKGTVIAKFK